MSWACPAAIAASSPLTIWQTCYGAHLEAIDLGAGMTDGESWREGSVVRLSSQQVRDFHERGYIHVPGVLTEDELLEIERAYDRFMAAEVPGMGRDLCDMSGPYDREFEDYALINAMLPRVYAPALQGNIYEQLASSIAKQLIGEDISLDYDQFLAKKPQRPTAQFAWHQDQGYWPAGSPDTRTATCSLAIDDSLRDNGCLRFLPGSTRSKSLRPHRSTGKNRDESHTLELEVGPEETVDYVEVKRGGITVHDEWVVHGSAGNPSNRWRRTYVVAFRSKATVEFERALGFTHSHNDEVNWETTLGAFQARQI
jgi:phytanoyl-CoA hydroxylase